MKNNYFQIFPIKSEFVYSVLKHYISVVLYRGREMIIYDLTIQSKQIIQLLNTRLQFYVSGTLFTTPARIDKAMIVNRQTDRQVRARSIGSRGGGAWWG